jgi:hypothetical protein
MPTPHGTPFSGEPAHKTGGFDPLFTEATFFMLIHFQIHASNENWAGSRGLEAHSVTAFGHRAYSKEIKEIETVKFRIFAVRSFSSKVISGPPREYRHRYNASLNQT